MDKYRSTPRVGRLTELLADEDAPARVRLAGLVGSQESFVCAAVQQKLGRSMLFVATDAEEARYLFTDLGNLLGEDVVVFFPDSFRRPMGFTQLDQDHVLMRTEVVHKLATSREALCVVTYPEALFEQVADAAELVRSRIDIEVGEKLNTDVLIEVLVEYGFRHEGFVFEPGQFSIRGGIVDVYSYGNELPYRIELFDDEVERVRTFDPNTQLSQQNIRRVSIVPNMNTRFKREQKVSLFEVLPKGAPVWIRDVESLVDKLQRCFEEANVAAQVVVVTEEDEVIRNLFRDWAFVRPFEVMQSLESRPVVTSLLRQSEFVWREVITFEGKPQPSFGKNFKFLIENLLGNTSEHIKNYLFTDNEKQVERFRMIFTDLGAVVQLNPILKGIHQGFIDPDLLVACYSDHQIFERYHRYRTRKGFSKDQALNVRLLNELQPGDYVTHIDHGIGRYSGLERINVGGQLQEAVRIVYRNNDLLYVSINALRKIAKYTGADGTPPQLHKLGGDAWQNTKRATKRKLKDIAAELIKLYAQRRATKGFAFPPDSYLQTELEASFLFEDTPDQYTSTNDVKGDMERDAPMDRLICGDVGFGKTEIAIRAAFKAATAGKQTAILVPTTILALQHAKTFTERLKGFPITVDYINRFRSAKEKKAIIEKLKSGHIDIIIGTHALLGKEIGFKDLGLLVIDEEQKFGVAAKDKLRQMKVNVDTLTMTATPIPRTMQFSMMSARDLSVMRTPPPNRQPIHTETRPFQDESLRDALYFEANRGGQTFFVHNRVQALPEVAAMIRELCPNLDVQIAHGQMKPEQLEQVLIDFIDHKFDVLVSTNIIETGLDISNANTIIINNAHHFGLSDLHQLRGRVGRSNRKAFCYLLSPPRSTLQKDALERLKTIEKYSDLGSGFYIAMSDLSIRGAGNLLGAEQSGAINDMGYETYQRILDEAIQELNESDFSTETVAERAKKEYRYVRETTIDTDTEMLIPDNYVSNVQERFSLYTRLDSVTNEAGIAEFSEQIADRFGRIPPQVEEIFEGLRLRWVANALGFERVILKGKKLRCYFVNNPQSPYYESAQFQKIMKHITTKGKSAGLGLKQTDKNLIVTHDEVRNLRIAKNILEDIQTHTS